MPLNRIPDEQREVCLDLIYDRRRPPAERLRPAAEAARASSRTSRRGRGRVKEDRSGWPIEQRLSQRIIDGDRDGLDRRPRRGAWPTGITPLAIINDVLLAGMKVVGELFGSGEMQLPFVLQSAETMKAAVAYLEPHMEKVDGGAARAASCSPP